MQGGSRRSAIFASLNWQHEDIQDFLRIKDYPQWMRDKKEEDFNFAAPMDMTNVSINWDTEFAETIYDYYTVSKGDLTIENYDLDISKLPQ